MSFWIYLVVALLAGVGLIQTMRGQARSRRYLEGSPEEDPLQLSHLSRSLQDLARDTRALRLSLEGPLRELREGGSAAAMLGEFDELQQRLRDAARELGEWVLEVERLSAVDTAYMQDVGADPNRVRALFEDEGWSLERRRKSGQPALRDRLAQIVRELEVFEERLQAPPAPYR